MMIRTVAANTIPPVAQPEIGGSRSRPGSYRCSVAICVLLRSRNLVASLGHCDGVRHRRELRLDRPDRLRSQEALAEHAAAHVAEGALQVARPDVLDQEQPGGLAGSEPGCH